MYVFPDCLISTRPPDRVDSMSTRITELQPPTETRSQSSSAESSAEGSSDASSPKDDERGASKTESLSESNDGSEKGGEGSTEGKEEQGNSPQENAEDSSKSKEPETEEEKLRREEVEMLVQERTPVMMDMFTCSHFHHVFEDSNADDGLVPDMPDEEAEGGGDATSGKGSGAGEGDSSGMAAEEKKAETGEELHSSK